MAAKESLVTLQVGPGDEEPIAEDSLIRFQLGKSSMDYVEVRLSEHDDKPVVEVRGGQPLVIKPRVSNSISVSAE